MFKALFTTLMLVISFIVINPGDVEAMVYFTKKNWAGCFTHEELSKILDYQRAGDTSAIQRLLDLKRCFLVKEDLPVYVVETGLRIIKIRPKGHTLEL